MEKRALGKNGPLLAPIGLGCMGLSGLYGKTDDDASVKVIQAALDHGINLLNTGDFYGMGHNEMLVGRAIKGRRDKAFVSVKYGALRSPDGAFNGMDNRPAATKNFLSYSLVRLGVDHVDLYQPARKDPTVPIEETVGAIAELIKAGFVRHIGLSEVSGATLRRAHAVHPISAVEHEYSLIDREIEDDLLPVAQELGVAIVAYGVLSRGMIQSKGKVQIKPNDFRAHLPRFSGENLERNNAIVQKLQDLAAEKNATATQIAFAWVISRGENIFPLVGAKSIEQLNECLASQTVKLNSDELAKLDSWFAPGSVAGTRYPEPMMAMLKG
ncbi:MAG: aldo/keto reductase [Candidatus Obscuribacterales bacterium]|nr:aldo/keto reductase [Candidatus Obscuribacterales bacterium]